MKEYYTAEELPPMDFWDLTRTCTGRFCKASAEYPDDIFVAVDWFTIPAKMRAIALKASVRHGYPVATPPDCVFVRNHRGAANVLTGWLKP